MQQKGPNSKHLLIAFATLLSCVVAVVIVWALRNNPSDAELNPETNDNLAMRDPLPGELVMETLMQDSVTDVKRDDIKRAMTKVINDYRKKFKNGHFTGYFLTDLDKDQVPELWVKVGSYRDNCKLELYYPMPDGTLRKSHTFAEPGQYYIGDDYIVQVVGAGPGYININRIRIHNGMMNVENERGIDLYSDPDASLPVFAEREIRDTSFTNLSELNKALSL